jgi:hypothetical protein
MMATSEGQELDDLVTEMLDNQYLGFVSCES